MEIESLWVKIHETIDSNRRRYIFGFYTIDIAKTLRYTIIFM